MLDHLACQVKSARWIAHKGSVIGNFAPSILHAGHAKVSGSIHVVMSTSCECQKYTVCEHAYCASVDIGSVQWTHVVQIKG